MMATETNSEKVSYPNASFDIDYCYMMTIFLFYPGTGVSHLVHPSYCLVRGSVKKEIKVECSWISRLQIRREQVKDCRRCPQIG